MRNTDVTAPKQRGTPFPPGVSGNPAGRPRGSRNRLADAFVTDLRDCWELHGRDALERVARDQPEVLIKVISSLMPKTLDLNLTATVDAASFAERFRTAVELLGHEPQQMPKQKTIEHAHAGHRR